MVECGHRGWLRARRGEEEKWVPMTKLFVNFLFFFYLNRVEPSQILDKALVSANR
jgi:hypothetical protein